MDIGGKRLVSIPYSYEINDSPFLYYRNGTIDEFEKMIRRQFDTLYAEGILRVDSRIEGFAELVEAAAKAAEMRGLSLSAATLVNLQALGVKLRDVEPDLREAAGGVA